MYFLSNRDNYIFCQHVDGSLMRIRIYTPVLIKELPFKTLPYNNNLKNTR